LIYFTNLKLMPLPWSAKSWTGTAPLIDWKWRPTRKWPNWMRWIIPMSHRRWPWTRLDEWVGRSPALKFKNIFLILK